MNKTAIYALLMALIVPIICYFFVKTYSETAIVMPRHYLPDSVVTKVEKGKLITDTVWHQVSDFLLTNQLGQPISWKNMKGKVVVADFFFTHCPTICPPMTRNMKRLQESIYNGQRVGDKANNEVHFLSFSIDPERDSVKQLKHWADRFQIDPDQWTLLTGNKPAIYDLAINEMKIFLQDGEGIDSSFIHSDRFVLIDSSHHVRGYYNGLDSIAMAKLSRDVILLTMEKDKTKKGFLAGKLQLIAIVYLLALVAAGIFLIVLRKFRNNA